MNLALGNESPSPRGVESPSPYAGVVNRSSVDPAGLVGSTGSAIAKGVVSRAAISQRKSEQLMLEPDTGPAELANHSVEC